ncbi:unnamed protein product [Phytophthora fragariaefolia]|uniref:Unnamed protein product n=1 Tax=Phytophthora fragariaefolia TaxID=1490495 RepID=A0A9W6XGN6_9STRA|nr:unnamed protein product [Phytophthora fragariaefolia]
MSGLPEKTQVDVLSLPEKTQVDVSSIPKKTSRLVKFTRKAPSRRVEFTRKKPRRSVEFTQKKQGGGSEAFPVVILDGGACVTKSSHQQADSPLVCETMAPCFRPDQEVYNLQVTERDLESFEPKEWLNDTVISYFIREFIDAHSSTYNFDGQLFGSIFMAYKTNKRNKAKTHEAVRGITATFPYAKYTTILIPVCMDAYWSFVIMQNPVLAIDGLTPAMLHVDSLQYHDTGRIERATSRGGAAEVQHQEDHIQSKMSQHQPTPSKQLRLWNLHAVLHARSQQGNRTYKR